MKTRRILALDLGRSTLKGILLEQTDSNLTVLRVGLLELPQGAESLAREKAVKQLLQEMPRDRRTEVVSVVDDPFLSLRQVLVPPMPEGELYGAVQWELHSALSVPPEEARIDFELLGETNSAGRKRLRLLAAALPASTIQEHLNLLAQAGLKPTQLIPKVAAIATWAHHARPGSEGVVALLYLGGLSTEFLVVQGKELLFARKIPGGGLDITRGMTAALMTSQGQMGLSEAEAEAVKRQVGIPKADLAESGPKGISGTQLLALIRGPLERLALEVDRSLAFYGESSAGGALTELILVGGAAHLKGLPLWLQQRLKIRVTVPDLFRGISLSPSAVQGPETSPSLSLVPALGACLGAGSGINLLPVEMKEAARTRMKRAAFTGMATAVVLGSLLVRIGMGVYHQSLSRQIAAFKVEEQALAVHVAQARTALAIREQQRWQPRWEEAFKELSQVLPREVHLVGLNIDGRQMLLRGEVREADRSTDVILPELMRALGEGLFTQVRLSSTRRKDDRPTETEFEIQCSLK